MGPGLRVFFASFQQRCHAVAPLGADGNDLIEIEFLLIGRDDGQQRLFFHGVDLVDHQHCGRAGGLDSLNQRVLLLADVCNRLDQQNDRVHIGDGLLDDIYHVVSELCARAVEAWGVDKDELRIFAVHNSADAVSRRLRLIRYDCDFLADQGVCERRLTDVRPAGNGDHCGFCFHW